MCLKPKPDFEKWAIDLNDIDGGNPKARLWFCGIEPGLDKNVEPRCKFEDNRYRSKKYGLPCWNDLFRQEYGKEERENNYKQWSYDQRVANILIELVDVLKHQTTDRDTYMANYLYTEEGHSFKINLYPLKKHHANEWLKTHTSCTGFETLLHYHLWCKFKRFPQLYKLVKKYSDRSEPKIIICTGKTYWFDFIQAFEECVVDPDIKVHDKDMIEITDHNAVTLLLTKFLGRCDSYKIAKKVKEWYQ